MSYGAFLASLSGTDNTPLRARHIHINRQNFGVFNWGSELDVEVLYAWPGSPTGLGSGGTLVKKRTGAGLHS